MVIDSTFVYRFVDSDLIFRKERTTENEGIDFEIGDGYRHLCTLEFDENFIKNLSAFLLLFC